MAGRISRHETNKKRRTIWLTDESWENLDHLAKDLFISRSELVELIGRGRLTAIRTELLKDSDQSVTQCS